MASASACPPSAPRLFRSNLTQIHSKQFQTIQSCSLPWVLHVLMFVLVPKRLAHMATGYHYAAHTLMSTVTSSVARPPRLHIHPPHQGRCWSGFIYEQNSITIARHSLDVRSKSSDSLLCFALLSSHFKVKPTHSLHTTTDKLSHTSQIDSQVDSQLGTTST